MLDIRPVAHVIGLVVCALGLSMALPMAVDIAARNGHWAAFLQAGVLTSLAGGLVAVATGTEHSGRLTIQQTFLLTTGVWAALPFFAALPFVFGATEARYVDAFFEAMSGLTTTGSTVFYNLDTLPEGLLLWRGLTQWFGGIGIIVVAMVFLPELRVGGMQIFRSEGFDTGGKILPRATEIASRIWVIYLGLTLICMIAYFALGMNAFDAAVHSMTTIATGGFANTDDSFGAYGPAIEYAAIVFMAAAALPFVRYVQLLAGTATPLYRDSQVRVFFATAAGFIVLMSLWHALGGDDGLTEASFRKSAFNVTSILTGTGYASTDYMLWGAFPVVLFFFAGLIGGCAGSTACSAKIFRYQLLFASITAQIRRFHSPHGMFTPRFQGRAVSEDVMSSVMAFFVMFTVSIGATAILLGLSGLDFITSLSGAATAIANVGPGLGPVIGPSGNFSSLSDSAKWLLSAAMLLGRLEIMAVFALFTLKFWRI